MTFERLELIHGGGGRVFTTLVHTLRDFGVPIHLVRDREGYWRMIRDYPWPPLSARPLFMLGLKTCDVLVKHHMALSDLFTLQNHRERRLNILSMGDGILRTERREHNPNLLR